MRNIFRMNSIQICLAMIISTCCAMYRGFDLGMVFVSLDIMWLYYLSMEIDKPKDYENEDKDNVI